METNKKQANKAPLASATGKQLPNKLKAKKQFNTTFEKEQLSLSALLNWLRTETGVKAFTLLSTKLHKEFSFEGLVLPAENCNLAFLKKYNNAGKFIKIDNNLEGVKRTLFTRATIIGEAVANYYKGKVFNHTEDIEVLLKAKESFLKAKALNVDSTLV